jgi:hypothetical protein
MAKSSKCNSGGIHVSHVNLAGLFASVFDNFGSMYLLNKLCRNDIEKSRHLKCQPNT